MFGRKKTTAVQPPDGYLFIGDSFVEGVGAPAGRGWAHLVAENLSPAVSTIAGQGGDTTVHLLNRWPRTPYGNYYVQVGTNDSRYRPSLKGAEVSIRSFERNLRQIVRLARRNSGARITFVGLLFVDETRSVPFKPDKIYTNDLIRSYDSVVRKVCSAERCGYITLDSIPRGNTFLADGVHPSEECHLRISQLVLDNIRAGPTN